MSALPANLDIEHARLPATYVAARHALAECSNIDVCKDWANKAEALASYARQANDQEMRRFCDRIQARAIRRCGELLEQIPPQQGGDRKSTGGHPPIDRTRAATEAGLSTHQRKTALRVASVPADDFEDAVESDNPPTVTELADRGRKPRAVVDHLGGRDPGDFQHGTRLAGALTRFNQEFAEIDIEAAIRGLWPDEQSAVANDIARATAWLATAQTKIGRGGLDGL